MKNGEWQKANEYDLNVDYIEKILKRFNIGTYNAIINPYGGSDLLIEQGLYRYKIEMDYKNCSVNIKRGKRVFLSQKASREYLPTKQIIREDKVWYDAIKWVSKDANLSEE